MFVKNMEKFNDDILQPIQNENLLQLRDLYSKNWPDKIFIFYYIDMSHTWITKCNSTINFYCVEGNFDDGTFIIISNEESNVIQVSAFTLEKSNERLHRGLIKTKRINWEKHVEINIFYRDQIPLFCDIARENQLLINYLIPAGCWRVSKQDAAKFQFEIPKNTFIGPLSTEHALKIHNVWPHRHDTPVSYIETLIKNNGGIGLFEHKHNTLLAWIMRNNYGTLAILQTDDNHKRKGYATIVTKALCKQFAENDIDPICFIVLGNKVSENLFKNLGFKIIDYIGWLKYTKIDYV